MFFPPNSERKKKSTPTGGAEATNEMPPGRYNFSAWGSIMPAEELYTRLIDKNSLGPEFFPLLEALEENEHEYNSCTEDKCDELLTTRLSLLSDLEWKCLCLKFDATAEGQNSLALVGELLRKVNAEREALSFLLSWPRKSHSQIDFPANMIRGMATFAVNWEMLRNRFGEEVLEEVESQHRSTPIAFRSGKPPESISPNSPPVYYVDLKGGDILLENRPTGASNAPPISWTYLPNYLLVFSQLLNERQPQPDAGERAHESGIMRGLKTMTRWVLSGGKMKKQALSEERRDPMAELLYELRSRQEMNLMVRGSEDYGIGNDELFLQPPLQSEEYPVPPFVPLALEESEAEVGKREREYQRLQKQLFREMGNVPNLKTVFPESADLRFLTPFRKGGIDIVRPGTCKNYIFGEFEDLGFKWFGRYRTEKDGMDTVLASEFINIMGKSSNAPQWVPVRSDKNVWEKLRTNTLATALSEEKKLGLEDGNTPGFQTMESWGRREMARTILENSKPTRLWESTKPPLEVPTPDKIWRTSSWVQYNDFTQALESGNYKTEGFVGLMGMLKPDNKRPFETMKATDLASNPHFWYGLGEAIMQAVLMGNWIPGNRRASGQRTVMLGSPFRVYGNYCSATLVADEPRFNGHGHRLLASHITGNHANMTEEDVISVLCDYLLNFFEEVSEGKTFGQPYYRMAHGFRIPEDPGAYNHLTNGMLNCFLQVSKRKDECLAFARVLGERERFAGKALFQMVYTICSVTESFGRSNLGELLRTRESEAGRIKLVSDKDHESADVKGIVSIDEGNIYENPNGSPLVVEVKIGHSTFVLVSGHILDGMLMTLKQMFNSDNPPAGILISDLKASDENFDYFHLGHFIRDNRIPLYLLPGASVVGDAVNVLLAGCPTVILEATGKPVMKHAQRSIEYNVWELPQNTNFKREERAGTTEGEKRVFHVSDQGDEYEEVALKNMFDELETAFRRRKTFDAEEPTGEEEVKMPKAKVLPCSWDRMSGMDREKTPEKKARTERVYITYLKSMGLSDEKVKTLRGKLSAIPARSLYNSDKKELLEHLGCQFRTVAHDEPISFHLHQ
ncbi:hypothetical protein FUAX_41160 (plasmid) [Fulvitalea axinellae]|uniref:Uncharacterized protein n=1 Tax=Fulvitalea axinellae TaxID=1182444 RepID=A0AAU9CHN9_9BACT|nr:hypothetical protein FUAX_41160 [Fulvitalea axinellae]